MNRRFYSVWKTVHTSTFCPVESGAFQIPCGTVFHTPGQISRSNDIFLKLLLIYIGKYDTLS